MQQFIMIFATWFGCGKAPKAPGTFGTLGALPLAWALSLLAPLPYMLMTIVFSIFAIFVSHLHEISSGTHDASEVVIDEVAGFLVTMTWVPFNWKFVLCGFVLFRLFDVVKPFPISYMDRNIKGGIGIVADDLVAGILSNIILQLLLQRGFLL